MKLTTKQKYTLYISVVIVLLLALFTHEFVNNPEYNNSINTETKNVQIYYEK